MLFCNRALSVPIIAEYTAGFLSLDYFAAVIAFIECLTTISRNHNRLFALAFWASHISNNFLVSHFLTLPNNLISITPKIIPDPVSAAPRSDKLKYTAKPAIMIVSK